MASQKQVTNIFESLWSETDTYEEDGIESYVSRHQEWSDGKIGDWITLSLQCENPLIDKINILDAGCGLGVTFANIMSTSYVKEKVNIKYTGLDLIDLTKTKSFIQNQFQKEKYHVANLEVELVNEDIVKYCINNKETQDLVIAFGSLHHTQDVRKSIISTFQALKPSNNKKSGYFIGWIINSQKPLRATTDKFFREFFNKFSSIDECSDELAILANIFEKLSLALGEEMIDIPKYSKLLDLKAGKYKLQSLLYDYFLKCYFRSDESKRRQLHQLFDWFSPDYYHQTTRDQLEKIILELNNDKSRCEILDIVSKNNGHYFFLRKHFIN